MVCLRDPEGVADEAVVLSPAAFFMASMLDGVNGAADVQALFAREFEGQRIGPAEIESVVADLDARGLLETPTFRLRRADAIRRFTEAPVRPPSHAGSAYPDDPAELREMIQACMRTAGGSGLISLAPPAALRGLVAPHIDFPRGGEVYAKGYKALGEAGPADTVLVLGVAHTAPPVPFVLMEKPFETPLGVVETDREATGALTRACGDWLTEEAYAHRLEHSIEFQLVWLQALYPARTFRIIPVLCSAFEQFCGRKSPASDPRIAAALDALREVLRARRTLVLASVDFSHVGPRFGDDVDVDERLANAVRTADEALLATAVAGDPEAFWKAGMADGNARRVDALAAVYTLLTLVPEAEVKLAGYGQAPDPAGGLVSFASLTLT